jgi:hypothetical protein
MSNNVVISVSKKPRQQKCAHKIQISTIVNSINESEIIELSATIGRPMPNLLYHYKAATVSDTSLWLDLQYSRTSPSNLKGNFRDQKEVKRISARCNGVLMCPQDEKCSCIRAMCNHNTHCRQHTTDTNRKMESTNNTIGFCPVMFYYWESGQDRWLYMYAPNDNSFSGHNHPMPEGPIKVPVKVKADLIETFQANPALTAHEVISGINVPNRAASICKSLLHRGRVNSIRQTAHRSAFDCQDGPIPTIMRLESEMEAKLMSEPQAEIKDLPAKDVLLPWARVYHQSFASCYIHLQSPLMSHVAQQNTYIVTDTKHGANGGLHMTTIVIWEPHLNRAIPVARMHHNRLDEKAYSELFSNFLATLTEDGIDVIEYIKSLDGALFDFSTAEAYGLLNALIKWLGIAEGRKRFDEIIRGCFVHWLRSAERVGRLICATEEEYEQFMKQCALMPKMMVNFEAATLWFQLLQKIYPGLKDWVQWWIADADGLHLRMLLQNVTKQNTWQTLPTDTNIVESIHNTYRVVLHPNFMVEMRNFFSLDRNTYDLMLANELNIDVSYRNNSTIARKKAAVRRAQARTEQQGDGRAPDTRKTTPALPPTAKAVSALCAFVGEYSNSAEGSLQAERELEVLSAPGNINSARSDSAPEINFHTFRSNIPAINEVLLELNDTPKAQLGKRKRQNEVT